MSTAFIDFSPALNYFLRRDHRNRRVVLDFKGDQSAKHLVESLGVPHTEVGWLLINGERQGLEYITQDGDRIEVQAAANGCPIEPRFLLDGHLGRLASYLRILGFDCLYRSDYKDEEMAELVQCESRILLTRDRRLLMRKAVSYGYCLRSLEPKEQLSEIIRRFDLAEKVIPFHRCPRCNHPLEQVGKEEILDRLEPLTKLYFDEFRICPSCQQVYWKGSHYEQMLKLIIQSTQDQNSSTV